MPTAGKAKTADMAVRTGLMRSVWHVACDVIYEELCAGRGVVVPDLGTFFIDTKESFLSTAGSTSVTRTLRSVRRRVDSRARRRRTVAS